MTNHIPPPHTSAIRAGQTYQNGCYIVWEDFRCQCSRRGEGRSEAHSVDTPHNEAEGDEHGPWGSSVKESVHSKRGKSHFRGCCSNLNLLLSHNPVPNPDRGWLLCLFQREVDEHLQITSLQHISRLPYQVQIFGVLCLQGYSLHPPPSHCSLVHGSLDLPSEVHEWRAASTANQFPVSGDVIPW